MKSVFVPGGSQISSIRAFGLLSGLFICDSVTFPFKFAEKYIIHSLYTENFEYRDFLQKWEISNSNSSRNYPYVIEFVNPISENDGHKLFASLQNFFRLLRLIAYNCGHIKHLIFIGSSSLRSISEDFSFSNANPVVEYLTNKEFQETEQLIQICKTKFINKNTRILRSLLFWDMSSNPGSFERRYIEAFIALESLFTTSNGQLTHRLTSRVSWFLESTDLVNRETLRKKIKKLAKIRGDIVHGELFLENLDDHRYIHCILRDILLKIFRSDELLSIFALPRAELHSKLTLLTSGKEFCRNFNSANNF